MVQDEDDVQDGHVVTQSDEIRRAPRVGRVLLFGGVAGACLLGAGLGLWARPSDIERPTGAKPAVAAVTPVLGPRRIPIVVDDTPAPIGKPLDVMAPSPARPAIAPPVHAAPPVPAPEMIAPTRPPNGLVKVAAPIPGPIESARPRTLLPPVSPPPGLAPAPGPAPEAARARAAQLAQQQAAQKAASQRAAAQKALAREAAAEKLAEARAAKAEHERELAEDRREARAERLAEQRAEQKARREKARQAELARAAPPPKPKHGLGALIARLAPHHDRAEPVARAEAKPERAVRRAEVKKARLARPAERAPTRPKAEPAPPLMAPKGGGPIRIANKCASADPGEALACGDPSLSAAERRLSRAYHDAEAAGVPAATLAQQQQRWKQARAAAAREAPWAVREVYQARIAELQDMTRDAQGN